jgi:hypothetical protein
VELRRRATSLGRAGCRRRTGREEAGGGRAWGASGHQRDVRLGGRARDGLARRGKGGAGGGLTRRGKGMLAAGRSGTTSPGRRCARAARGRGGAGRGEREEKKNEPFFCVISGSGG